MKKVKSLLIGGVLLLSSLLILPSCSNEPTVIQGEKGDKGEDGRSVVSITLQKTEGNVDTYVITYSDGTTSIFQVTNGVDGQQGIQGVPGKDGVSPTVTIGANGNWFINGVDSGISAKGDKGDQGEKGDKGDSPYVGPNGNWWVGENDTGISAYGNFDQNGLFYFLQDDGTYGVSVGSASNLSYISVPSVFNNKPVTKIVDYGFSGSTSLRTISLPDTLTSIGEGAFAYCRNLTTVISNGMSPELTVIKTSKEYTVDGLSRTISVGMDAFDHTKLLTVEFNDGNNFDDVDVSVSNYYGKLDSINYSLKLNSKTDIESIGSIELPYDRNDYSTTIHSKTFGLFRNSSIELVNGTNKKSYDLSGLAVTADEYIFAPLNASYPVLVYSLKLQEITDNGNIPSFVFLERNQAYNWSKLPYNLSYLPNVSRTEATAGNFWGLRPVMASYIKELHELNPTSIFNLYCVDNYAEVALEMLVANQIPETNWTLTMLSDGAGTAGLLNRTFAVDNPNEKLNEMINSWNSIKKEVFRSGKFDRDYIRRNLKHASSDVEFTNSYPYAILKAQSNVRWWVNRLRTGENLVPLASKDINFANAIISSVEQMYTNNLLSALDETGKINFKNLYHFSDDMFKESQDNGQKIMIILGTSWAGEASTFYDYLKMTMAFYGTEYDYYYKGHPGYPTINYPTRGEQLNKLRNEGYKITELDNAIAAEVILFYNPDVYLCGWQTSVFDSVESEKMACSLFNVSLANKNSFTYGDLIDVFISKLTATSSLWDNESLALNSEHSYYVMEFNNSSEIQLENYNKHEIAIYDATENIVTYYKLQSDGVTYLAVAKDGTTI